MGHHAITRVSKGHVTTIERGYIRITITRAESSCVLERWQRSDGEFVRISTLTVPYDMVEFTKEALR